MRHITLICDFCGDTVANYDVYSDQEDLFKARKLFDSEACDTCYHTARAALLDAINKMQKKKEE